MFLGILCSLFATGYFVLRILHYIGYCEFYTGYYCEFCTICNWNTVAQIVFKMDKYGSGKELVLNDLAQNTQLDCTDFTHDMVIRMCILAGCDYLQSLPGIGIKRAHGFVKQYKTIEKV